MGTNYTPISGPVSESTTPEGGDTVLSTVEGEEQFEKDPILEALRGPVGKLVNEDVRLAIDPEKIFRYAELRRNELYWKGNQYLDEVYNSNGQLVDYRPIDGTWHEYDNWYNNDDDAMYYTVVNDYRGYGRKFIAVLANQAPNVKIEPNDPENSKHCEAAKKAQEIALKLHNLWNVKKQNRKVFLTFYKNGTCFGYTRFIANGEKYGYTEEPIMEERPVPIGQPSQTCVVCGNTAPVEDSTTPSTVCPTCGTPFGPEDYKDPEIINLPQQVGVKRYANGCVEHVVESELRVTTQFDVEELTDCPWLLREREIHTGMIFQRFPELKTKFRNEGSESYGGGGTSTTSGQITRDIATSPSGIYIAPRKNRLMFSECWLRPSMYELARGSVTIKGQPMELQKALNQMFPTGLKISLVAGDYVCKLEEETMDDMWTMTPPEVAENAYPDPIGRDFIDIQDQTNDFANIFRQTYERAIPQTFIDTRKIDTTFQSRYRQLPGSYIPVQVSSGNINDAIGKVPTATPDPNMDQYGAQQRDHGAEIIGITPQVYGGGAAEATAYATNLKRNQAMLQLSMYADSSREYWNSVTYNAIMLTAKFSNGKIPSAHAPRVESEEIEDMQIVLEGGWHCEPADGLAMSWPEQREQLNENMKNLAGSPQLLDQLGYTLPSNIPALQDKLIGIPYWDIPNQQALMKLKAEIRELLQGQPQEIPSTQMPGQTIQIPSIPVDEFDPHAFIVAALEEWFQGDKAQAVRKSNPNGFSNVVAFWKAHKGLANPPAPMPPGPGGPGGPGPGGPGGGPQGPPPGAGPVPKLSPPHGGQAAVGAAGPPPPPTPKQ